MAGRNTRVRGTSILFALAALAGCRDLGLEGNVDVEQATNRALPYQVYDTGNGEPSAGVVGFENRSWMRSAATEPIPDNVMVNVGMASGMAVFAPSWSRAPHTRLYIQSARGRWHPLIPVP